MTHNNCYNSNIVYVYVDRCDFKSAGFLLFSDKLKIHGSQNVSTPSMLHIPSSVSVTQSTPPSLVQAVFERLPFKKVSLIPRDRAKEDIGLTKSFLRDKI